MNDFPSKPSESKGYLGKDEKKKFRNRIILVAVLFLLAQFAIPLITMIVFTVSLIMSFGNFVEPQQGALSNDQLWYLEEDLGFISDSDDSLMLKRINLETKENPEEIEKLSVGDAWLLPAENGVWIVSFSSLANYSNSSMSTLAENNPPWNISSVFLYQGQPA